MTLVARGGTSAAAAEEAPSPAEPGPQARASGLDVTEALPRVLKIVGSVAAPTTLLTGLLIYFGRLHITGLFRYLGVNFTLLDLSVQDYLVRSADGLFVPIAVAAAAALLLFWAHRAVVRLLSEARRRAAARWTVPLVVLAGLLLLAVTLAGLVVPSWFASASEVPGLALAVGVLLLAYGARLVASTPPTGAVAVAEWGAVFTMVAVGLFWAVGNYALGVGTGRAQQIEQGLAAMPDVVLYSEKDLRLSAPGVGRAVCGGEDSYRYRYDGLKLIIQSGGQYLFLPASWTHDEGAAFVVPRSDSLRLEFSAPGRTRPTAC